MFEILGYLPYILRGLDTLVNFLPFYTEKTTFVTSSLFFCTPTPSESWFSLRGKNFLSREQPASVAQSDVCSSGDRRSRVRALPGRQHFFIEIDYEIFSTVILSLPLIQEELLSVSGERMCTSTG